MTQYLLYLNHNIAFPSPTFARAGRVFLERGFAGGFANAPIRFPLNLASVHKTAEDPPDRVFGCGSALAPRDRGGLGLTPHGVVEPQVEDGIEWVPAPFCFARDEGTGFIQLEEAVLSVPVSAEQGRFRDADGVGGHVCLVSWVLPDVEFELEAAWRHCRDVKQMSKRCVSQTPLANRQAGRDSRGTVCLGICAR